MKNSNQLILGFALVGLGMSSCGHEAPPKELGLKPSKHRLAASDPRSWDTYPIVVLVAVKHRVGIDTIAQILRSFEGRFGDGFDRLTFDAQLPAPNGRDYEEDATHSADDAQFFVTEARKYGLGASAVADIIFDFYLIGGSNRDFPEKE